MFLVRYASGKNFNSISRTISDFQLIHRSFLASGGSIERRRNTSYRARGGFKLKPMSVRNFLSKRIFQFRIVHFVYEYFSRHVLKEAQQIVIRQQ